MRPVASQDTPAKKKIPSMVSSVDEPNVSPDAGPKACEPLQVQRLRSSADLGSLLAGQGCVARSVISRRAEDEDKFNSDHEDTDFEDSKTAGFPPLGILLRWQLVFLPVDQPACVFCKCRVFCFKEL